MTNNRLLFFLVATCLALSACQPDPTSQQRKTLQQNPLIFYDVLRKQLVHYDEQFAITGVFGPLNDPNHNVDDDRVQLSIENADDLYIDNNLANNTHQLIQVTGNTIQTLHAFTPNTAIYPVAFIENAVYVLRGNADQTGNKSGISWQLIRYDMDSKQETSVTPIAQQIAAATAGDDQLYYSAYNNGTGFYDVYQLNISGISTGDISNVKRLSPNKIYSDLSFSDIYWNGQALCWTDAQHINCPDKTWDEKSFNLFKSDRLLQVYGENGVHGLTLAATNLQTGSVTFTADNVLGIRFDDDQLQTATKTGIKTHTLTNVD